jgi:phospholipid N-methyltransferase|tara:strand:+ start:694 stop:1431 length:738 start_codon:yes stop_codon:yes gene_type:complete
MIINAKGARAYWESNVWDVSQFKPNNGGIDKLSHLVLKHLKEERISNPQIIELCSGTGSLTMQILANLESLASYHCVDVNQESLSILTDSINEHDLRSGDKVVTHCGYFGEDGYTFDSLPDEADVIICCRALHHIPNMVKFIAEASSRLRVGGAFIADIIPKSERFPSLKDNYSWKAYPIETAYLLAAGFASLGVGSEFFTRIGLLRTNNPRSSEVNDSLHQCNLTLGYSELDRQNHYYRFIAKK